MQEKDDLKERQKEVLQATYTNFDSQYMQARALMLEKPNAQDVKMILFLRTKDRMGIHPYQFEVKDGREIFTRVPFWHAVSQGRSGEPGDDFFQVLTPDGFAPSSRYEKQFGFVTRQGVDNTAIYGTNDPSWSLVGIYAKPSTLPPILGDSFVLQLYENAFKTRQEKKGKIKTVPFSEEPRERSPQILYGDTSCWAAVEHTMPEDIHGIIVVRDWREKDMRERLEYYRGRAQELHIPLESLSVCLAGKQEKRGEKVTSIEEIVDFQTILTRYTVLMRK